MGFFIFQDISQMNHISLYNDYTDIVQIFPDTYKQSHGAIFTSFSFIETMFSLFDKEMFDREDYKWCDLGCGLGYFSIVLYFKLMTGLSSKIPDKDERSTHILEKMIYMIDVQHEYETHLKTLFGNTCHVIIENVLEWKPDTLFDVVIGNPPFHCNHIKQVPTNKETKQTFSSSKTIWPLFVLRGFSILNKTGYMNMVVPSLWCKYDSYGVYDVLVPQLVKMRLYNNTESNKIFHYQAQTPCSIFLARKCSLVSSSKTFSIYDAIHKSYVPFSLTSPKQSIPMISPALCLRLYQYAQQYGSFSSFCLRTNMPRTKINLSEQHNPSSHVYENIHSCILDKKNGKNVPVLVYKYSNISCIFQGQPKLVLAHKMYGFPYYDKVGRFGVSNRDNYIIYGRCHEDFLLLQSFTSSILFIYMLECFKFRMKMIEPSIIPYIPDVTKMKLDWNASFTTEQNDEFWFDTFKCSLLEKEYVRNHFSKQYERIPIIE